MMFNEATREMYASEESREVVNRDTQTRREVERGVTPMRTRGLICARNAAKWSPEREEFRRPCARSRETKEYSSSDEEMPAEASREACEFTQAHRVGQKRHHARARPPMRVAQRQRCAFA